jgi:hypothetical protein
MEIVLAREQEDWRVAASSLHLTEELPPAPTPPASERGTLPDGRTSLTIGLGDVPATLSRGEARVLVLRADRKAAFSTIASLLGAACEAGFEEIRIRPERRERAVRGTSVLVSGVLSSAAVTGAEDPPEIVYPVPRHPASVDLVIGVGRRARLDDDVEDLPFRASLGPEASRALARFTELLGAPLARLDVLVSVHDTTDLGRLAFVLSDLEKRGCRRPALARENPHGAGYASAILINGLRPDQVMRTTRGTIPRVWPDNPVLQRTFARPE